MESTGMKKCKIVVSDREKWERSTVLCYPFSILMVHLNVGCIRTIFSIYSF